MKKFFYALVAILFGVIGCQHIDYIVIESNSDSCKVLELDPVFEQPPYLTIGDLVDTMKVVALETTSASILSRIKLIKIVGEYIIIKDDYQNGSITLFNINGKFIRRIPHGDGPGEINAVRCFDVDEQFFYVLQYGKVNKYTYAGDFVDSYPTNMNFHCIKVVDDGFLLCVYPCSSKSGKYEVHHIDKDFKTKNKFVFNHSFVGYSLSDYFKTLQNDIIFFPSMCNTIYQFDGTQFRPFYVLNYPKYANNFETNPDCYSSGLVFQEKHCIKGKYFTEGRIFQGNGIIFITLSEDGSIPIKIYIDAKSGKFRSGFIPSRDDVPVWPLKYGVVACTYDNYFVQTLPPDYYLSVPNGFDKEHYNVEGNHLEESVSQLRHISDEDKKKILNAKDDDNPLIIMYKLKSIE